MSPEDTAPAGCRKATCILGHVRTVIVVPHRGLRAAKTRLAPVLPPAERADLTRRLLQRVLDALVPLEVESDLLVISPDPELAPFVEPLGARLVVQRGMGLNDGLDQARADAVRQGAETLVVLHGDLPLLEADDVHALIAPVRDAPGVAIAPDRARKGTNALALRPPEAIPFRFGPGSFEAHAAAARANGLPVTIVERPGLAFDLDTPADLDRLLALEPQS